MLVLTPRLRRVVYVASFEFFAIILSTILLAVLSGDKSSGTFAVAVAVSLIAVIWNYVFNTFFEAWERRNQILERTVRVRICHAVSFEVGLIVLTIPLYMIWYRVGFIEAFKLEAAILVFFLVYTYLFTRAFDSLFALPGHRSHVESRS